MNLVRYLDRESEYSISLVTTSYGEPDRTWFKDCSRLEVSYLAKNVNKSGKLKRLLHYLTFNLSALWILIKNKPDSVLYYETISAWSPCFYKRFINKMVKLFIHYHEYNSPADYDNGMKLTRWFHSIEKQVYGKAVWISHTNEQRMSFFSRDVALTDSSNLFIFPNYPPLVWYEKSKNTARSSTGKIAFVYVGALSLETMYTKEMAQLVAANPESCYWDIYSGTFDADVKTFLQKLNASNIYFKGAASYYELPDILPKYDIGVILYKGTTDNFRYNAPNKLFEYMACGLNVLYPVEMEGVKNYENRTSNPWVKSEQFYNLQLPEISPASDNFEQKESRFFAEQPFSAFLAQLNS